MKNLNFKSLALVLLWSAAGAAGPEFKPEFAADQAKVTSTSLLFEAAQFQSMIESKQALEAARVSEVNARKTGRVVERYAELVKSHHVTEVAFAKAQLDHMTNLKEIAQHKAEAAESMARAKVNLFQMKSQGNPDQDYLKEEIEARIELEIARLTGYKEALEIARETLRLAQVYLANGKRLRGGDIVSDAEIDYRVLLVATAAARVDELIKLIELAEMHKHSLERCRTRS